MAALWSTEQFTKAEEALSRHRFVKEAAAELRVTAKALQRAFARRGSPASHFLLKPNYEQTIPDGHRIRGNSTLLGEDGEALKRWVKTERASDDPSAIEAVPPGHLVKKVSTLLDGQGQVRAQWIQAPKDKQNEWEQFWAACSIASERYRAISGITPAPSSVARNFCTVYPLGDPHIGMLAWHRETGRSFDLKIAERDLLTTVEMLVESAPPSRVGVLANVGDFFHAENDKQLTPTGGNKLDVDGRSAKVTEVGFTIMRRMVDLLLLKHEEVRVVNVPGNHDPSISRMLNYWVKAVYEKETRVEVVDNANPIMYMRHGKVLLGFHHGDTIKMEQLPAVMATERPQDWGETVYRQWITGHVHHQIKKEFPGCLIESFRTLAPSDAWHHGKGYRSGQSLCCITFDSEYGERTRSTVDLRLARAR